MTCYPGNWYSNRKGGVYSYSQHKYSPCFCTHGTFYSHYKSGTNCTLFAFFFGFRFEECVSKCKPSYTTDSPAIDPFHGSFDHTQLSYNFTIDRHSNNCCSFIFWECPTAAEWTLTTSQALISLIAWTNFEVHIGSWGKQGVVAGEYDKTK